MIGHPAITRIMFLGSSSLVVLWRHAQSFPVTRHGRHQCSDGIRSRRTLASSSLPSSSSLSALSDKDHLYLSQAMEHARNGFGRTYPNPAVGCVLVRDDTDQVLGGGFHPRAGFPHAEVFALLEAAGHVPSGVDAAKAVVSGELTLDDSIQTLAKKYSSEGGPNELLGGTFQDIPVTAYVTLEPCCHTGKTPPCANALVLAQVDRVVVGFRDPNPRVDGGGVKLLEEAGITVELADGMAQQACADLVDSFVKRIVPKDYDNTDYAWINGAMRRALRRLAGKQKAEDALTQHNWTGKSMATDEAEVNELELDAMWMERLDFLLWQKELVNVRLNKAVGKKKLAQLLGERIASELGAHVAQTVGHTSLLYRPGVPPFLDLKELVNEGQNEDKTVNGEADGVVGEITESDS